MLSEERFLTLQQLPLTLLPKPSAMSIHSTYATSKAPGRWIQYLDMCKLATSSRRFALRLCQLKLVATQTCIHG